MAPTFVYIVIAAIVASAAAVNAESHTIRFDNQCGKGTPQLIFGGHVVSNGSDWTSSGPASSGIAYLQTGECLLNGEHCALLEMTLGNPTCPGCGSSTDISLIPPHALNVPVSFSYFNGCDGQGAACDSANCNTAFFVSDDNQVQVACQEDNVDLLITFCGNGATSSATSEPANAPTPSSFPTSSPASPHESPEPTSSSIVHTSIVESSSTAAVSLVTTGPFSGPSTVPSPTALSGTSSISSSTVSLKTYSVIHTSIAESSSTAAVSSVTTGPSSGPSTVPSPAAPSGTYFTTDSPKTCSRGKHSRRSKARAAHVQMNAARVHA